MSPGPGGWSGLVWVGLFRRLLRVSYAAVKYTNGINAVALIATPPVLCQLAGCSQLLGMRRADGRVRSGRPTAPIPGDCQIVRLDARAKLLFNSQAEWCEFLSPISRSPIVRVRCRIAAGPSS